MKPLRDFNFKNKRVLVRCDFNVPLDERGNILDSNPPATPQYKIADDFRIKETVPTIEYLIKRGARVILMSHLGRPDGKVVENLRLTPIQEKLMEYLDLSITKANDCIGKEVEDWAKKMQPGEILLLENLRFYKGEEGNDDNFARNLAKLGDIYINDAFADCHRPHASIISIPKYLPSGIGFLVEKEISVLTKIIKHPRNPLVAIIGGEKVERTKLKLINDFSANGYVLLGGLVDKEIKKENIKLKYPEKTISPMDDIETFDIGPQTINLFKEKIAKAKTIFWNGPLGKIEEEKYQKGTKEIVQAIIESGAFSVVGGGETVEFINKIGLTSKFNHVSTGGGAMLAFLSGEKLPGLIALNYYAP